MPGAVIYARISTHLQKQKNNTLPSQLEKCERKAKELELKVLKRYSEVAKGDDGKRQALLSMQKYIQRNAEDIGYLIVSDAKRLSRSIDLAYKLVGHLRENKVEIIYDSRPDIQGEKAYIYLIQMAYNGQLEKQRNAEKTREKIATRQSSGQLWGRTPLGLSEGSDNKKQIKRMFKLASEGMNYRKISDQLLSEGFGFIPERSVSYRLHNSKYCGIIYNRHTDKVIHGDYEPVISEALFYKVQDILNDKVKRKKAMKSAQTTKKLPLRRLILCKGCGYAISGSRIYYVCNNCKFNARNDLIHAKIRDFLNRFDYNQEYAEGVLFGYRFFFKSFQEKATEVKERYFSELEKLQSKTSKASPTERDCQNSGIMKEIKVIKERIRALKIIQNELRRSYKMNILLKEIGDTWSDESNYGKTMILKKMFPSKLIIDPEDNSFSYKELSVFYEPKQEIESNIIKINKEISKINDNKTSEYEAQLNKDNEIENVNIDKQLIIELYHDIIDSLDIDSLI